MITEIVLKLPVDGKVIGLDGKWTDTTFQELLSEAANRNIPIQFQWPVQGGFYAAETSRKGLSSVTFDVFLREGALFGIENEVLVVRPAEPPEVPEDAMAELPVDIRELAHEIKYLLGLLSSGSEWTPADLEERICGGVDLLGLAVAMPRFNRTPFSRALRHLVEVGAIRAWQDEEEAWHYQIAQIPGAEVEIVRYVIPAKPAENVVVDFEIKPEVKEDEHSE